VVLVFIASTDASSTATAALTDAVAGALGAGARVIVQAYGAAPPGDDQLEAEARAQGAAAAARLVWDRPGGTRAALDVYLADTGLTVHRGLTFEPQDEPVERGRAIGLVLASLLLAESPVPPPPEPQRPPPDQKPSAVVETAPVPPGPWALEGFADGGLALGGAGAGIGGGLASRFHLAPPWGLRLGLHARGGSVAAAQASSLAVALSAGVFRSLRPSAEGHSWDLAARAELLFMYETLTHFSTDDPEPVRKGRFLPGGAALLEAQWRLSTSAALHLAGGLEGAFGVTRVVVRGQQVAELAAIRAVLEAGFRARF
jgi:hypothetical protein